jgi:GMP synthase (glutamine-hydrolysing)
LRDRDWEICSLHAPLDNLKAVNPGPGDLLIILGGPIGAYEEARYPFLNAELKLIERALAQNARVLGVCLGAQLLARVLGARVYPGSVAEIGFAPLTLTSAGLASPLRWLESVPVLHWHGDSFDLPVGSDRLASTPAYENQAFRMGRQALGLQFHAEACPEALESWLVGHAHELAALRRDLDALRADTTQFGSALSAAGSKFLLEWIQAAP